MTDFFELFARSFQRPLTNPVLIFSLILFIILLSPIVLRKFRIPGIIGLILSGVLIGPFGFGLLENDSSIKLFSTIGLLYIMFLAGLDLDMNQFKSTGNKSLIFGLFTFILPLSIGFPVCYYVLGFDFMASFLTASMFATHTLVAYPIVSKFGIVKNQAVAITVGGTILTDTLVLIILAIVLNIDKNGSISDEFFIRLIVSLVIFVVIMFFLIPRMVKWFFSKLESEKHSHFIFVLSIMFFAAFLAEIAGLEAIIGSFAAGLVLNKFIPHSSTLMNRLEFIGNALFIPFFLISVGMLLDLTVLVNGYMAVIIALTLTAVAISGKWIAALFTQWVFRFNAKQRRLIFGLSSSHAAATLAIILAGYHAGILDENILNGTIILILITCIVASFVTEIAAKQIVLSEKNHEFDKNTLGMGAEHILLPISKFTNIPALLDFTILIKDQHSHHPISILSVVPNDEQAENNIIKTKNELNNYVIQASSAEVNVDVISTIDYNIAGGIARVSREIFADMIVLGWTERNVGVIDKFLLTNLSKIIRSVGKTIFICQIEKTWIENKRIFLMTPPYAEMESGFEHWVHKIIKLANELSLPIEHYGDMKTKHAINKLMKKYMLQQKIRFSLFTEWDDFLVLSRNINDEDLIVWVSSRQGFVSYSYSYDLISDKLTKYFKNNNKIAIYPEQNHEHTAEVYGDISSEPITQSIKTIEKIGKGIGGIFKKKDS